MNSTGNILVLNLAGVTYDVSVDRGDIASLSSAIVADDVIFPVVNGEQVPQSQILPEVKTPNGYVFDHWSYSVVTYDGVVKTGRLEKGATHIEISELGMYKVVANFLGARTVALEKVHGSEGTSSFVAIDESLPLESEIEKPVREGYIFNGYYEKQADGSKNFWYDYTGDLIDEGADESYRFSEAKNAYPLTSDVTLYADWVRDVTLDAQGGDVEQKVHATWGADMPNKAISGADECAPGSGPVQHTEADLWVPSRASSGHEMFRFNGYWSDPVSETGPSKEYYEAVDDGAGGSRLRPVEGRTWDIDQGKLYAHWIANLDWRLNGTTDADASAYPTSAQNAEGDGFLCSVVAPDPGHRSGFAFDGWKVTYVDGTVATEDDGTTPKLYQKGDTIPIRGHATIEAQWTALDYSVELDLGAPSYEGELFQRVAGSGAGIGAVDGPNLIVDAGKDTDGHVVATTDYKASADGGRVVLPRFARAGYELMGWRVKDGGQPSGTDASGALADMIGTEDDPFTEYAFTTGDGADPSIVRGNVRLQAVWSEAESFALVQDQSLDGNTANPYVAGTYDDTTAAYRMPAAFTVTGLPLHDLTPKLGYEFVGWKAHRTLTGANVLVPAAALSEEEQAAFDRSIANGEPMKNVRIASNITGDDAVTLVACFTTVYHSLTVDLGLSDAEATIDASLWTKAESGNAYLYKTTTTQNDATTTVPGYGMPARMIDLPTPHRAGQTFLCWDVTGPSADVLKPAASGKTDQSFSIEADKLGDYRLTAVWDASPYGVTLDGIAHLTDADGGSFVSGGVYGAGAIAFDGDDLTDDGKIAVRELAAADYDTERYDGFLGWYLPEGTGPKDAASAATWDAVNEWRYDAAVERWYAKSVTITKGNVDALCTVAGEGDRKDLALEARFQLRQRTIDLALDGGMLADASGWTEEASDAFSRAYDCASEAILLPASTRYGYEFMGWVLSGAGIDEADLPSGQLSAAVPETTVNGVKGYWVQADRTGDRLYTAKWRELRDEIRFEVNGGDAGTGPARAFPTFAAAMPDVTASGAPTRTGYDFAGYFDTAAPTGGKQYYTHDLASACAWDKAPEYYAEGDALPEGGQVGDVKPHVLYARWTPSAAPGTFPENEPQWPTYTTDPLAGSTAFVASKVSQSDGTVLSTPAFSAHYNGRYVHGADGTIEVAVDSYASAPGASAKDVYDAFNAANGSKADEFLAGFLIESTGDIISLADIARGTSFSFTAKASDLNSPVADEPTFALKGEGVVALYSSTPFDFTDPAGGNPPSTDPVNGESTIFAVFNGNGGTIGGKASAYTSTLYRDEDPKQEHVLLPGDEPTRMGYAFVGWSVAPACGDACEHTKAPDAAMFKIEDILKKTYYAHWEAEEQSVFLHRNDGTTGPQEYAKLTVPFGSEKSLAELGVSDAFQQPTWPGHIFLGYFDGDGVQAFTRSGDATGSWDRLPASGTSQVELYAHWMSQSGTSEPSAPETPGEGVPIDPSDLLPPAAPLFVVPATKPSDNGAFMVAIDGRGNAGRVALDGTYDGVLAFPEDAAARKVAIVINAYEPASVDCDVRHAIADFEANAPAPADSAERYLQGFRVLSTGSFISAADLATGRPITITAEQDDLDGFDRNAPTASFRFAEGKVEAVYGPTPAVRPDDMTDEEWKGLRDPKLQVTNVFDARGGSFASGQRFATVATSYGDMLVEPTEAPSYAEVDQTYYFDGWYTAAGVKVSFGEDHAATDAAFRVTDTVPQVLYARYVRSYYAFELYDSNDDVVDAAHERPVDEVVGTFKPYAGETLAQMATNAGEFSSLEPAPRDGYDFVGYFYREADGAGGTVEHPLYLSDDLHAREHPGYAGFQRELAALNGHDDGWGRLLAAYADGTPVKLYAKWNPIVYQVKWVYNWTDRGYDYQEPDDGGAMVSMPAFDAASLVTVPFGSVLDIPTIKNPVYGFRGWYAGTAASDRRLAYVPVEYDPGSGATEDKGPSYATNSVDARTYYFVERDGQMRFEPHGVSNIDDKDRTLVFYAQFDVDPNAAVAYGYRIYFGHAAGDVHGELTAQASAHTGFGTTEDGVPYYYGRYFPADEEPRNLTELFEDSGNIVASSGYGFAGWSRADGAILAEDARIPQWSTGLQEFYLNWTANDYAIRLKLDTLRLDDGFMGAPAGAALPSGSKATIGLSLNEAGSDAAVGDGIVLPEPIGQIGYVFAGWKRCESSGALWTTGPVVDESPYELGTFGADFIDEVFVDERGAAASEVFYGAVWKPITYEVRFMGYGGDAEATDAFDSCLLTSEGGVERPDGAQHTVTMPYPHAASAGYIFRYWTVDPEDTGGFCQDWASGTEADLATILARASARGEVSYNADDPCKGMVKLYAFYRGAVSADVALEVNMLLDPYSPNDPVLGKIITNSADAYLYDEEGSGKVVANAWVGTESAVPLRIESLTYERGDDDLFETAANAIDGTDMDLQIYAARSGETARNPLTLNLGAPSAVVLRDGSTDQGAFGRGSTDGGIVQHLSDHGLSATIVKGEPLYLYYDLALADALTLQRYPRLLNTADAGGLRDSFVDVGAESHREKAVLAKLYYTIGLAPQGTGA